MEYDIIILKSITKFWSINQVIQTYQTRIIQGLKDIEHRHHQTFRFVKGNSKLGKFKENNQSFKRNPKPIKTC